MPRPKKIVASKRNKVTSIDVAIEERLAACGRREAVHIIYVGDLVERALKGEIGAVLKALMVGRTSREISDNRDGKLSADRILGRLEMVEILWCDLEQFVLDKDTMKEPVSKGTNDGVESYNYSPE